MSAAMVNVSLMWERPIPNSKRDGTMPTLTFRLWQPLGLLQWDRAFGLSRLSLKPYPSLYYA